MRLAIVGGTGKLGSGLALRWASAGHTISLGSRAPARARAHAAELQGKLSAYEARDLAAPRGSEGAIQGGENAWAAGEGEVVVLTVPYEAHAETLRTIVSAIGGKVLLDTTVPLKPPGVSRVHVPPGQAAALEAQALVGASIPVVAALHHVSATHVANLTQPIASDVLVASDDARAKSVAMGLVRDLGLRGLDAGPLVNAIALESLTPVLIHLNRTYKSRGTGIVFTDLPGSDPR
ncbi:MAG TPA: NADPH-dependent F420 reductase [Polyangiaceae bacterium]|nr:NADPH-dependent F420 reductase [Polyangiaceae bacterium]